MEEELGRSEILRYEIPDQNKAVVSNNSNNNRWWWKCRRNGWQKLLYAAQEA